LLGIARDYETMATRRERVEEALQVVEGKRKAALTTEAEADGQAESVTGQVGGVVRPSGEWRSDAPVRL
jgi:hypothetical protein